MKLNFYLLACCILTLGVDGVTEAQTSAERVATGLTNGLYLTHAPEDTNRVFMLEQTSGRIRVMDLGSGSTSTFMTITGLSTGAEKGLLGLAFDPDYQNNGYFYTYTSRPSPAGSNHQSVVTRYTVDPLDPNTASTATAFQLMSFTQPFSNHNGGWLGFNPMEDDPYLYIASGDGGSFNDPQNNAQDITNKRLGKMLRIDVSGDDFPADPNQNYAIPADNPFVGQAGDDEIWSYGLRNPWRNSFDPDTGDLWIGDVGQDEREEINYEPFGASGRNYGWRVEEGFNCFDNSQTGGNPPCGDPVLVEPVHDYGHNAAGGFSVTGGYVYRGSVAQYEGLYFFADYVTRKIWTLDPYANDMSSSVIRRNAELPTNDGSFNGIASFGEDGNGELYIVSHDNGNVHTIVSTSMDATWNGDDAVGTPGDGSSWTSANNWTRGSSADMSVVAKDRVIFAAGSSVPTINLEGAQTVGAMEFQADYRLTGGSLVVLSGNVHVAAGAVANIDVDLTAETTLASLRKRGAGRLNFNGDASQTVVLEGTLGGFGSVDTIRAYPGARVSPGEVNAGPGLVVATLTTNAYQQQAGATLEISVDGSTSQADQLLVNGPAEIDGELEVTGTDYPLAARGTVDEFVIVAADSLSGGSGGASYNGVSLTMGTPVHVGDGLFVTLDYSSTEVTLTDYFALPGDANGDRIVDGADFLIWNVNKFSDNNDWTTGDFNGDGITDGGDFIIWNGNKFTSVPTPPPVPEPAGSVIALFATAGLLLRRRYS